MLETLAIRGYRGFESCRLTNLARVNLVVGRNNCGKTTVLEAIELLASGGSPLAFLGPINRRRGAVSHLASSDISHLLFGHTCVPGAGFDLSSDDTGRTFSVKILPLDELGGDPQAWFPNGAQGDQVSPGHPDKVMMPMFGMRIVSRTSADAPERTIELPIMEDGSFPLGKPTDWLRNRPSDVPVRIYSAGVVGSDVDERRVEHGADERNRCRSGQRYAAARTRARIDSLPYESRGGKWNSPRSAWWEAPSADRQLWRRNAQTVGDEALLRRGGGRLSSD